MIAHDHGLLLRVLKHGGAAFTFILEGKPAIAFINDHPVKENRRILIDCRQAAVGKRGQHRCMNRMHMHHAAGMAAMAVDRSMQPPGGRVRASSRSMVEGSLASSSRRSLARSGKMTLIWIHQELSAVVIHRKAEVIGNSLMHIVLHRPAERAGKIHPLFVMIDIEPVFGNAGHAHPCLLEMLFSPLVWEELTRLARLEIRRRHRPGQSKNTT